MSYNPILAPKQWAKTSEEYNLCCSHLNEKQLLTIKFNWNKMFFEGYVLCLLEISFLIYWRDSIQDWFVDLLMSSFLYQTKSSNQNRNIYFSLLQNPYEIQCHIYSSLFRSCFIYVFGNGSSYHGMFLLLSSINSVLLQLTYSPFSSLYCLRNYWHLLSVTTVNPMLSA